MKCLFILPRMGGGGAERVVSILANELSKDNDVTVYTLVGGDSFYKLESSVLYKSIGVSVNRKNVLTTLWSKVVFFPKSLFKIYKKIKSDDYDIVFSMLTEADILVGCCKFLGLKFRHVCSERNDPTKRRGLKLKLLKAIYKRASLFVCQGKMASDFYKEVPEKIKKIIANPIDPKRLPPRSDAIDKKIVAIGRLDKQKNFPLLINSFFEVHKERPEYKLDIYGEGPERTHLQQVIDKLELSNYVKLHGAKSNVLELISDAALFVMSSNYEGFPNALLEAMAIGLPVISTDFPTGIAKEIITEENGIVVPIDSICHMKEAILRLLSDENVCIKMGQNNRLKCQEYYVSQIVSKWTKELYEIIDLGDCKINRKND